MPRQWQRLLAVLLSAGVLLLASSAAPQLSAAQTTSLYTPTLVSTNLVTSSAATGGDGGNGWLASKLRIVRDSTGTVYTTYVTPVTDTLHKQWYLVALSSGASSWTPVANGLAGREPVNLLLGPQNQLDLVSWPNGLPALWNSATGATTLIPGAWPTSDYPYHVAGIDAQGGLYVLQSVCACSASTPNVPGEYATSYDTPATGQWHFSTFSTDYRYTSLFLFPTAGAQLTLTGTRDVLWAELGYTQPAGTFSYVFNDARQWVAPLGQAPTASLDVHQEVPTSTYPNVASVITDAYVDTSGRLHLLYSGYGPSSNGQWYGRHAIIQNGVVVKDVASSMPYQNLSRLTQDTTGRFHLIAACGNNVWVQSGSAGDTDGTQLGATQTFTVGSSYSCNAYNNYITAPRSGTALADVVDGVFDSGSQWIYYRLQLAASASPPATPTPTATTLSSAATPAVFGQGVTSTAKVAPTAGTGTPTGTVQFQLDGSNVGGPVALSGGSATSGGMASMPVGTHRVGAVYSGDATYAGSSGLLSQVVTRAGTAAAVTASTTAAKAGQTVTLSATVTPVAPGAGTPSGTVTFLDGTKALGSAPLSNATATFSTAALSKGKHSLTAVYSGDGNFLSSTSPVLQLR